MKQINLMKQIKHIFKWIKNKLIVFFSKKDLPNNIVSNEFIDKFEKSFNVSVGRIKTLINYKTAYINTKTVDSNNYNTGNINGGDKDDYELFAKKYNDLKYNKKNSPKFVDIEEIVEHNNQLNYVNKDKRLSLDELKKHDINRSELELNHQLKIYS